MAHAIFPKAELKSTIQTFPGGTHVVMGSVDENDQNIYAIDYKYSSMKVLSFIASEGTGATSPGRPYEARCTY